MVEYRVIIPEEEVRIIEFIQDGHPGVAYVNRSLKDFEPKVVFGWHLSIMIELQDLAEKGMPSLKELEILEEFGKSLNANIVGTNNERPNAIFLARITWNKTRELIWRIHDPELSNNYLQQIISDKSYPRQFDYRIDPDNEWKLTEWHLNN